MNNFQTQPLKIYIQDIYRAKRSAENKYIYELFGLSFKNINIHGVVTDKTNTTERTANFVLCDPTGTIQVYYDTSKSNSTIRDGTLKNLKSGFTDASKFGDANIGIISTLMDKIARKKLDIVSEGNFLRIVGDIFLDENGTRKVSAFECFETSVERDLVWLEELRYLYDKIYIKSMQNT